MHLMMALHYQSASDLQVSSNSHCHNIVWIVDGFTALDGVNILHAFDHLTPNRVLAIQETCFIEANEKL